MGLQSAQTPPQAGGASDTSPLAFGTAATDTTLSETLITLRKRKRVLLAFVLAGLLYGIYAAETQPRIFEAFGRIQVRSGSSNEYRVSAVSGAKSLFVMPESMSGRASAERISLRRGSFHCIGLAGTSRLGAAVNKGNPC